MTHPAGLHLNGFQHVPLALAEDGAVGGAEEIGSQPFQATADVARKDLGEGIGEQLESHRFFPELVRKTGFLAPQRFRFDAAEGHSEELGRIDQKGIDDLVHLLGEAGTDGLPGIGQRFIFLEAPSREGRFHPGYDIAFEGVVEILQGELLVFLIELLKSLFHPGNEILLEGFEILIQPGRDEPFQFAVKEEGKASFLEEDGFLFFFQGLQLFLQLLQGTGQRLPFELELETALRQDPQEVIGHRKEQNFALFFD